MLHIEKNQQENVNNKKNGESKMISFEQQSFIGCEVVEEKSFPIKEKSKLSKIGKKLPEIRSKECFRFNKNLDFSEQKNKLDKYGASEVYTVLIGGAG